MPYISKHERARGGWASDDVEPDLERDWSIPTDLNTLRRRVLPTPDQSRYGPRVVEENEGRKGARV